MNQTWLIYTTVTIAYIIILIVYFLRRSKHHEEELTQFLSTAKDQIDLHKNQASLKANLRVKKAAEVVRKVQQATELFEEQVQEEYEQIIQGAKEEKHELIAQAKTEVEELFKQADQELEEYRQSRYQEVERNLVKLVMSVAEKVTEQSLTANDHKQLIFKTLQEIKSNKSRT